MIAEGNNELFHLYSDYFRQEEHFYSQNSFSDIIVAHLKMLSFQKYYPVHEDPRGQNVWIVNPFVEYKVTTLPH
jgi:hypothetical protein